MDDARLQQLLDRSARDRYFRDLELQATKSQTVGARKTRPKSDPTKPKRKVKNRRRITDREHAARKAERAARKAERDADAEAARADRAELRRQAAEFRMMRRAVQRAMTSNPRRAFARRGRAEARRRREVLAELGRLAQDRDRRLASEPSGPPEHCVQCGRPMRPCRTLAVEHPGTVLYSGAHGECSSCYSGWKPRPANPHDGSTSCVTCHRTLRSRKTPARDAPGTVAAAVHLGDGWQCDTCYIRERKGRKPQFRRPKNCIECGVEMRSAGSPGDPNTRVHAKQGRCSRCHSRLVRAGG